MKSTMSENLKLQQDVTILYQGGSGGFMLYYYLLLTGRYNTGIKNALSVQDLIRTQFPSTLGQDRRHWKQHEFWPDNVWAKNHHAAPRLYLICNPFFDAYSANINQTIANGTFKILLWTDIRTQVRMTWEKNAWWFTNVSRQRLQQGTEFQYLRWILNQGPVDPDVEHIAESYKPDLVLNLQDFIRDPQCLGMDPDQQQLDFLEHWVSLQSEKSQRFLGRS